MTAVRWSSKMTTNRGVVCSANYRRALYVQKQAQKRSGAKESRSNGKWEEMGGWKEEKFRRGRVARYIMYRETRPLSFSPCCAADVDSFEAVSISGGG